MPRLGDPRARDPTDARARPGLAHPGGGLLDHLDGRGSRASARSSPCCRPISARWASPTADRLAFVGLFSALIFVVGMPLVPLWGAWADKYSRKVVIVRSALVEAVVFAAVALAREPWQVALAMLLIGFQLGNTGIMLAGIRDVTPRARLGHDDRDLRGVGAGRVRGRAGARGHPHRRLRLGAAAGLRACRPCSRSGRRCSSRSARTRCGPRSSRPAGSSTLPSRSLRGVLTDRATRRIFTDLRHLVRGHPDEPAVHPVAGRGHRRARARASPRRSRSWPGRRRSSGRSSRRSVA